MALYQVDAPYATVAAWVIRDGDQYATEMVESVAEATAELQGSDEPGETRSVWTGLQKPAMYFLRKSTEQLGRDFAERMDEWLAGNIAAEEEIVEVKDYAALGAALLDALEQHATFNRWAVHQVQEHEVIVPGEPEAPN
jgi:hypothetical protein